jgi:hypothetical protein
MHCAKRSRFVGAIASALAMGVVAILGNGGVGVAAAATDTADFCGAYDKLQADPTNPKVIRKQLAKMASAKPPNNVKQALGVLTAAAAGDVSPTSDRAVKAGSTLARYVAEQCFGSGSTPSAGTSGSVSSRCPLTVEQVSTAVGTQLEDKGACTFFAVNDAWPNVIFVRQVSFACDANIRSETGYTERLGGLGTTAYVQRETAEGPTILVCTKPPFEISVDIPTDQAAAFTAAQTLASQVLKGS